MEMREKEQKRRIAPFLREIFHRNPQKIHIRISWKNRIFQPRLISLVISLIVASRMGSDDSSVSTALMLE